MADYLVEILLDCNKLMGSMGSSRAFWYAMVATMLTSANAYADTHCNDRFHTPCDEGIYQTCVKDLCTDHEWLCEQNADIHNEVDLVCACTSLTNKEDTPANKPAKDTCPNTKSPQTWKAWISQAKIQELHYCSEYAKAPCNLDAYKACVKDICPPGNEIFCKDRLVEIQLTCTCTNLINEKDKAAQSNCSHIESAASLKDQASQVVAEAKRPHYCNGYVHSPCDEEKFQACSADMATTFCPGGAGCEGIGPALVASCACENLLDKKKMANEEFCQHHIPPAELKSTLLKEMHK